MLKPAIRHLLVRTPLRRVAAPAYDALTRLQLSLVRLSDQAYVGRRPPPERLTEVTAIVKTFERPTIALRLVASIRRLFPRLKVIIADDSRVPLKCTGVEVVALPFDSGVSLGRQAALERVRTEFTWVLDDDFVLYSGTRLDLPLLVLTDHPAIDLVGGPVINLPLWSKRRSDPMGIYPTRSEPLLGLGSRFGGLEICDKVPNFFVARTERLRSVGWTPELKRLDHADFFTRARGILVTAYCDGFRCLHGQTPFDTGYQQYRQELAADRQVLQERYYRTPGEAVD